MVIYGFLELMIIILGLDVSDQTRRSIKNLRNQLLQDIMVHYENEPPLECPEVRLGNLILMLSSIKVGH